MCGRYTNQYTWRELHALYSLSDSMFPLSNFQPRYNMAPTQIAPVVRLKDGKREVVFMRWGLVPFWSKDTKSASKMINAQSETADVKPAFRAAWKSRRCLVIADGFYEWPEPGKPRHITLKDKAPFAFAGLWESWKQPDGTPLETFTILTTTPNEFMAEVHNRMPVMLTPEHWAKWLGEVPATTEELKALCVPFASERMTSWPVDKRVGNVRNDDPEIVRPVSMAG